ncbi:MAG: hypothetical protein AAF617_12545, partial [Bacteroidota bacterium]
EVMEKVIRIFHYISFIKYPILIMAVYYMYKPYFTDGVNKLESYNTGLIIFGVAMAFESLKDHKRLTWLDKKVFHKPKIAIYYFIILGCMIITIIAMGCVGYFSAKEGILKEVGMGLIVTGIGTIGLLKSGIEATKYYMEIEVSNTQTETTPYSE